MLLKSIIFTGSIQGLFLILLLKTKKANSYPDRILMLWLAIISIQLMFYYDSLSNDPLTPGLLKILAFSLPLLNSAIFYLYIKSLAFGWEFEKKTWIHVLPYLFFNALSFSIYFLWPGGIEIHYGFPRFSTAIPPILGQTVTMMMALVPAYYIYKSFQAVKRYQKLLPDHYSYTEKINLTWLKWIMLSLVILFVVLFLVIKYGIVLGLLQPENLFAVVGSVLSFYVFFIGYAGLRQTTNLSNIGIKNSITNELTTKESYKKSGITELQSDQLFKQLSVHMENQKPFLDEALSLSILAEQLEVTANQLSQVINQQAGTNFFNYVNGYRIAMAKQRLADPAFTHFSILGIAYDCGFRSKSSFNKLFKEQTNTTPSEYQKLSKTLLKESEPTFQDVRRPN
ncbi:helix-turn-helix domain-containing protein [Pedobacter gandavensis]|uniref:Helix-turn-helix domain-containing protein n=1 Tax=Pedobacter gandavensis TaxID=2679963 RepID=A0ABR6ERP0_9SPHI|nr:helix-turn-helix transcriptional regulator [Pedobacter gandavensis]MBB2147919.1 helix-turn-helix domain-containing protein [Pedobacter gandavensis]